MKIGFTGGGTGGHFYPIIAIAQQVNKIIDDDNILGMRLYYFSNSPYDKELLFENGLEYVEISAGKRRLYFSIKNFFDLFKMLFGVIKAIFKLFIIYPDVIFSKGGFASFPTLFAARILRIPIIIHESDSAPGRVNKLSKGFARKIAISFPEAAEFFPREKVAWTGQPIRMEIEHPASKKEGLDYFKLESNIPVILVLGGSQGAELINDIILDSLLRLVDNYQIIHQTGIRNFKRVTELAEIILEDKKSKTSRYLPFAFLNTLQLKMAAGAATIIVSRPGSIIFEIASWAVPSILIPITESNNGHQKKNSFNYARAGACSVIEETNLTPNIFISEIQRITGDQELLKKMSENAKTFFKPGAASKIARFLVNTALSHEKN